MSDLHCINIHYFHFYHYCCYLNHYHHHHHRHHHHYYYYLSTQLRVWSVGVQAVAMNVRFIKLGAPNRGERVSKFNRLLQIEAQLEAGGKLAPQVDHEFKHMSLPYSEEAEGIPISPTSPRKEESKKEEGKKEGKKK